MKKTSRRKKILYVVLGMLLVFGLSKYLVHILNSPAEGTVSVSKTATVNTEVSDSTNYSSLANSYFSLLSPSHITSDLPEKKPSGTLTYDFLTKRDSDYKIQESIEVYLKPLPDGGVTLDGDYKRYTSNQDNYKMTQKYMRGEMVNVVTSSSKPVERAALWVHGDYLLILKLTSDNKADSDIYFNTILKSIQWLKT